MSYYKYIAWGVVGLGIGAGAFSGYYIMNLETMFDHLKGQVLDPNAVDSEWQKLDTNIKSWGGDWKDRLSSKTRESLKSGAEDHISLRDWCRSRYKSTFKSLFETINPLRTLEVRSVCVMTETKPSSSSEPTKK